MIKPRVARLWPPPETAKLKVARPRCEVIFPPNHQDYDWRMIHGQKKNWPQPYEQCIRPSTYRINGENLCTQHAGKKLLDAFMPPEPG